MSDEIKKRKLKLVNDIVDQVLMDSNEAMSYASLIGLQEREQSLRSRIKGLMSLQIKTEQQMIDLLNYHNQLTLIQNMIKENMNAKPYNPVETEEFNGFDEELLITTDVDGDALAKNNEELDKLEKDLYKKD